LPEKANFPSASTPWIWLRAALVRFEDGFEGVLDGEALGQVRHALPPEVDVEECLGGEGAVLVGEGTQRPYRSRRQLPNVVARVRGRGAKRPPIQRSG